MGKSLLSLAVYYFTNNMPVQDVHVESNVLVVVHYTPDTLHVGMPTTLSQGQVLQVVNFGAGEDLIADYGVSLAYAFPFPTLGILKLQCLVLLNKFRIFHVINNKKSFLIFLNPGMIQFCTGKGHPT